MNRRIKQFVASLLLILLLGGCGNRNVPRPSVDSSLEPLLGQWEQFIPVESLPATIEIFDNGSADIGGESARWQLTGDRLRLGTNSGQRIYSYTLSGYMMTLYDVDEESSAYYINPVLFAASAGDNEALNGRWGAFGSYSRLEFDGKGKLDDVIYTSTGETILARTYAARDGILQSSDRDGNYTYNLYRISDERALLLAETSDFDHENKQWTAYWQLTEPPQSLYGDWTAALMLGGEETMSLPVVLSLAENGEGSVTLVENQDDQIQWLYYSSGFIQWATPENDVFYAHIDQMGETLYLNNTEDSQCWYLNRNYNATPEGLKDYVGTWKDVESDAQLTVKSNGTLIFQDVKGKETSVGGAACNGLIYVRYGGEDHYLYAEIQADTLVLVFDALPFWDQVTAHPLTMERVD